MLRYLLPAVALCTAVSTAHARDFGLERFADIVSQTYPGYSVFAPFIEAPSSNDPLHFQSGYLGSVWRATREKGRNQGGTYSHSDLGDYCNPNQAVMPPSRNTLRIQDWRYKTEITVTGELTVSGARPEDTIFKLSAIDAKYIKDVTVDIKNAVKYAAPYNILVDWSKDALSRCPSFDRVLTSAIAGDVTVKIYFVAGVSATLQFDIASKVKANLGFNVTPVQIGTADKPAMVLTEGSQIFAVTLQPAPLR